MDNREQQQRERAYRIWEAEGRVEGAQEDHWRRAGAELDLSEQESEDVVRTNQDEDIEEDARRTPGLSETMVPPLGGTGPH